MGLSLPRKRFAISLASRPMIFPSAFITCQFLSISSFFA
jgi:hypothetical protein